MSVLLYAIADAPPETIGGAGIGDAPLGAVGRAGLVAVVSRPPEPHLGSERLWEYERVLERLMASHPVLPARFGTVLSDEAEARTLLARRGRDFRRALELVKGAVELGLRAEWRTATETVGAPTPPGIDCDAGTAYMRARLGQLHRAREIAALLEPLNPLSRWRRVTVAPRPELAVTAAYLVERSAATRFAQTVARLDLELEDVAMLCTGPWPPYSFAEGAGP